MENHGYSLRIYFTAFQFSFKQKKRYSLWMLFPNANNQVEKTIAKVTFYTIVHKKKIIKKILQFSMPSNKSTILIYRSCIFYKRCREKNFLELNVLYTKVTP